LDIEWLLSTLFDASLLSTRAAGNDGSFFNPRFEPISSRLAGNYVANFAGGALDRHAVSGHMLNGSRVRA
jgi:hypothetical protein